MPRSRQPPDLRRPRSASPSSRQNRSSTATTAGSLFLIGGKDGRNGDRILLDRFVTICGGSSARVLVVTTASSDPKRQHKEYAAAFRRSGARRISIFHPGRRTEADDPALLTALNRADGLYFSGGNQLKLVATIGGTMFDARFRERHREGLVVGGTSAGASALSVVMIAGGRSRHAARFSSVELSAGLGLLPKIIVDQHFRQRDRIGRLLSAVLRNPAMLGFGLDEGTAVEIDAAGRVDVLGAGTLTIVDGSELQGSSLLGSAKENSRLAFAGMRLHVLGTGWRYDLATREAMGL
ncbi:MAG: cyanophycinase [Woeseiaceae bacterium]